MMVRQAALNRNTFSKQFTIRVSYKKTVSSIIYLETHGTKQMFRTCLISKLQVPIPVYSQHCSAQQPFGLIPIMQARELLRKQLEVFQDCVIGWNWNLGTEYSAHR